MDPGPLQIAVYDECVFPHQRMRSAAFYDRIFESFQTARDSSASQSLESASDVFYVFQVMHERFRLL